MSRWICTVCNYVHEGDAPPDICPVCGVGKESFVLKTPGTPAGDKRAGGDYTEETLEQVRDRARTRMRGIFPK